MNDLRGEWQRLLTDHNDFVLRTARLARYVPTEARDAGWCGHPPASEENIQRAESRLGVLLPSSYRDFLKVTNGWSAFDDFIFRLSAVDQIDRYRTLHPDWAAASMLAWERNGKPTMTDEDYFDYANAFTGNYRDEYLPECLVLGDGIDAELVLLNPMVIAPDGEWEAWYFANWIPGAYRYRSFIELCRNRFELTKAIAP